MSMTHIIPFVYSGFMDKNTHWICYVIFFFLLVGGIGYVSMNRIRKCRDNMIWSSGFIIADMVQNNVIETIFRRIWYVM